MFIGVALLATAVSSSPSLGRQAAPKNPPRITHGAQGKSRADRQAHSNGSALFVHQAYDVLGNVMSLMGGLTSMNASVVFPSLFYLRLFWGEIGVARYAPSIQLNVTSNK